MQVSFRMCTLKPWPFTKFGAIAHVLPFIAIAHRSSLMY